MISTFLWKMGNKVGKTLKVNAHTIKKDNSGGELNTIERGRFARISVEINLEKKLIPRIKIRNRIYMIEYEGLNLICFKCGKYGHHKDNCSLQQNSECVQHLDISKENNEAPNHNDIRYTTEVQQKDQDNTFGSWMVVTRNFRNKNTTQIQTNVEKAKNHMLTVAAKSVSMSQIALGINGSRFVVFDMDDDCIEVEPTMQPQRESINPKENTNLSSMQKKDESRLPVSKDYQHENNKTILCDQDIAAKNDKHEPKRDIMKSKSIVEKFAKATDW